MTKKLVLTDSDARKSNQFSVIFTGWGVRVVCEHASVKRALLLSVGSGVDRADEVHSAQGVSRFFLNSFAIDCNSRNKWVKL